MANRKIFMGSIGFPVDFMGSAPHELNHYGVKIRESFAFCFPIIK
jgi:hypothetical protein